MNANTSSYDQLEKELGDILKKVPATHPVQDPTFLSLSGYPNYENVISNLYAFFLQKGNHGLDGLFLEALGKSINTDLSMMSYKVTREYSTNNRGRIDLVLMEEGVKGSNRKGIFIENKIYHHLANDLEDYRASILEEADSVVGIMLSIHEMKEDQKFHFITHKTWISNVQGLLGNYVVHANPKYLILLQDFIQHIQSFYKKETNMDSVKFLYRNGEQVKKILELNKEVLAKLVQSISTKIGESNWVWSRGDGNMFSIYRNNDQIYLYVHLDKVFSEKVLTVSMWLKGSSLIERWNNTTYSEEVLQYQTKEIKLEDDFTNNKQWVKTAWKEHSVTEHDILHFQDYFLALLSQEWEPFTEAMVENFEIR